MKKKNQKVADLKKLAMLGLAAGLLMPGQAVMADNAQFSESNFDHYLAGGGCGGSGSCSHNSSGYNAGYYQQQHSCQSQGYQGYQGYQGQAQHSCQAQGNQAYQAYQGQAQHSCQSQNWQSQAAQHDQQQNWQTYSSCNSQSQPQNIQSRSSCNSKSQQNWTAQSGCGGQKQDNSGHHYPSFADSDEQGQNSNAPSQQGDSNKNYRSNYAVADNDQVITAKTPTLSEKDLMNSVNAQSKAAFQSLSPEGKAMALKLANQDCKGKNDCKGQNSCKTAKNDCAGKGGCKGQSSGPFKDKNLAIKVAAMKMAEKRNGVLNK